MAGFSEVLQTIGAIIIFSLILLTTNRIILGNSLKEVESEAESVALSLAQNIIEEAQTKAYDENTTDGNIPVQTPDEFSEIATEESTRKDFDDFDDYNGYTAKYNTHFGIDSFTLNVDVRYVSPADNYDLDLGSLTIPTHFKKMRVTVTSDYLDNNAQQIQMEYLQRYYKTKH